MSVAEDLGDLPLIAEEEKEVGATIASATLIRVAMANSWLECRL